jgi:formate C-acetyltransferase
MINYYASAFAQEGGRALFKQLLSVYFARGGMQHQPNVMDAEQLRAAQENPAAYKDLIVRMWGVSAPFVDLPREIQDELISRLG